MFKTIALLLSIVSSVTVAASQTISNCDRFRACSARNDAQGSHVDYEYLLCGQFGGVGVGFSGCINNNPEATCPSSGCESRCNGISPNWTGFTHTYFDCNDTVHIDTTGCSGCPQPSPTPTPTPLPNDYCYPCPGDPGYSSFSYDMCFPDYHWSCTKCTCIRNSPVLVDSNGDGFALTDGVTGVFFDFNGDGPERISWTAIGSDDAFLVLDRNGNGTIDNGGELFGNVTPQPVSANPHGFLALAEYDKPANGGNADGIIDKRDAIFAALRLWQDANHNALSEAGELHTLKDFAIDSIDLNFKESRRRDQYGNEFRYRAKLGGSSPVARYAWDVFLTYW
jgi:hypothetical protein